MALEKLDDYNGALNLGTRNGISVKEIITRIEKNTVKKCLVEYSTRREGDPAKLYSSNDKARTILGWKPEYTIDDIIASAWKWEQNRRF